MILRQDGDDLIQVEIDTDEENFISMNPDFIQVQELPFSNSGYYLYNNGEIVPNQEKELLYIKSEKMDEVQAKFQDMMFYGYFTSSLGFVADNRRGDGKDDKDNVSSLIDLGQEPVYFRDHNNQFHALSLSELNTLKQEMIQDGLSKYQWKWNKENEVMSATDIETLENIIIL